MTPIPCSFLASSIAVFLFMTAMFFVALFRKDNSIIDIAWGAGFVLVWAVTFVLRPEWTPLRIPAGAMTLIWATRLSLHIYFRNRGRGEDPRYARWRRPSGRVFFWKSYVQIFLLQGMILILVASPVIVVNGSAGGEIGGFAIAGMGLWLAGFAFEAAGDAQLRRFKKDPGNRGRIMTRGLWKYSRHPNYFGEALMWGGVSVLALSVPDGCIGLISPLVITLLLTRVSGIPLLEKKYRGNPEFEDYARRTSALVPWFPRKA